MRTFEVGPTTEELLSIGDQVDAQVEPEVGPVAAETLTMAMMAMMTAPSAARVLGDMITVEQALENVILCDSNATLTTIKERRLKDPVKWALKM